MHSNFITPPDYVESILILNATQEQITALVPVIKALDTPYNIFFYHDEMNMPEWRDRIKQKADTILDANLTNLEVYFNK
jgi:hypothetical protein